MTLETRTCVITGAGSGIGRSIARRFAREGAKLVLVDIDGLRLAKVSEELGAEAVEMDVTDPEQVARLFDRERVDVLCNNAGVLDKLTPLHEVDDGLWRRVMSVNVDAPFLACRAAIPKMLEQGGGAIVNTCSAASLSGGRAGAAYTASKHALLGLTRSIAWYYGPQGVRCNAMAPGAIQTRMQIREVPHAGGIERYSAYFQTIPPHGKAMDVAEVALFLASDASRYVNGAVVPVDGGWNAF